jgi:hypothetical protein
MTADTSVRYMDKSRDFYAAHGYDKPYVWSHFDDIPFAPLNKPLAECKVTIVTTSMPDATYTRARRRFHIGDLHNPPATLYNDELAWDHDATHTDDLNSFFPAAELARRVDNGEIGELATHFYCVPTIYSQRNTMERDAPAILKSCLEDAVDVALLVPL